MAGMIRQRYGPSAPFSRFCMACSPFQGGMLFRRIFSHAGVLFFSVFHHWLIWTELSGGLFSFRCFWRQDSAEMTLCGSGGAFRPRGASGRRLFHYSGPLPAGNRNNGRIRPGMRGERRGNGKFQKSVKIILVNTVQNHDAWHIPPAFCLSAEAFPFIVMHGLCPVPVVQWIERVSPKD